MGRRRRSPRRARAARSNPARVTVHRARRRPRPGGRVRFVPVSVAERRGVRSVGRSVGRVSDECLEGWRFARFEARAHRRGSRGRGRVSRRRARRGGFSLSPSLVRGRRIARPPARPRTPRGRHVIRPRVDERRVRTVRGGVEDGSTTRPRVRRVPGRRSVRRGVERGVHGRVGHVHVAGAGLRVVRGVVSSERAVGSRDRDARES
mmetsp:Transcript_4179/g.17187  ORF Transcript_4179/g.17187 Transcript_4179/m.17187 type:complete len:206 (+) Transcript_4179:597-1214(+)